MSDNTLTQATEPYAGEGPDPRRWVILAVIAIAQLMIVLDASIMNIALPSAQEDLGISPSDLQWIITAYTLAFGGLLLLGGRIADYLGRKRTFLIGLVGFALASGLGGFATNEGLLFAARALQGAFGALLAPAALAIMTVTFSEAHERAKAFGVFGAISGGGAAIGLILGGVLTDFLSWRWCLFVNIPIALVTAFFGVRILRESKASGDRSFDIPGTVLATSGLFALVFAFTEAAKFTTNADGTTTTLGFSDPLVVSLLVLSAVLLVAFVILEMRVKNPLLPLRIVLDHNRGGSYLVFLLVGAGLFAMFFFMALYFQQVLGYSALKTGFAYLPFSLGIILFAGVAAQLMPRVGPKPLMLVGLAMAIGGMLLLLTTTPDSGYWTHVFPPMVIMSTGMALVFIPTSSTALIGVGGHDAGIASAVLNTSQQIGGSLGLAMLSTLWISAVSGKVTDLAAGGADPASQAVQNIANVHGFHVAWFWGAMLLVVAFVVAATLISAHKEDLPSEGAVAA